MVPERQLKLLVYNVFQENKMYEKLIHIIDELNPHLILLLETDEKWDKTLAPVYKNFKYINKEIRNDTYGLIFMSQFDCIEGEIDHLISKKNSFH